MVEVFGIHLIEKEDFLKNKNKWLTLVDDIKRERIQRLIRPVDSQRSLFGEILIRSVLCKKLNLKNKDLSFNYNKNDKPFYSDGSIHFNISHSGEWVVCATSKNQVGIDVEKIRKFKIDLAERFFSSSEVSDLHSLNEKQRNDYFFELWTIKESYLKLLGRGLTKALNTFTVTKLGNDYKILSSNHSVLDYFVKQYQIADGYKMAVVAEESSFSKKITIKTVDDYLKDIKR
ncbi:4'-phosphopantetheinyl transferase family protein [Bacteroidota bacterium]